MKTMTLDVQTPEQEEIVRQFHAYVLELEQLALTVPDGQVVEQCEAAVIQRGRDIQRQVLAQAVQRRIDTAEKKGHRCGSVAVVKRGKTVARRHANS